MSKFIRPSSTGFPEIHLIFYAYNNDNVLIVTKAKTSMDFKIFVLMPNNKNNSS